MERNYTNVESRTVGSAEKENMFAFVSRGVDVGVSSGRVTLLINKRTNIVEAVYRVPPVWLY